MNPLAFAPLVEKLLGFLAKRRTLKTLALEVIDLAFMEGLPDNEARRAFAVTYLVEKKGFSESDAQLLVQLGVKLWKKAQKKAEKRRKP